MTEAYFCEEEKKNNKFKNKCKILYPVVVASTGGGAVVSQGNVGLKSNNEKKNQTPFLNTYLKVARMAGLNVGL